MKCVNLWAHYVVFAPLVRRRDVRIPNREPRLAPFRRHFRANSNNQGDIAQTSSRVCGIKT